MKRRRVDASLYDAVLYLCILHESGAGQYAAVKSLSEHTDVFGPAAAEFSQAVSDVKYCGCSIDEGLSRLAETTKSKKLRQFISGYRAAVRTTGTAVPYLQEEAARMQEEEEQAQRKYLESLTVLAEIYLTLFVATPLFAVIAGLVLGMTAGAEPYILGVLLCLGFPAGTAVFLLLLDSIEEKPQTRVTQRKNSRKKENIYISRLLRYERRIKRREMFRRPIEYCTKNPEAVLFASLPAAFLFSLPLPTLLLQAGVFLLTAAAPFAVFHTRKERRMRDAEGAVPEICRVLAGGVSRGMTLADAVCMTADEGSSALQKELQKTAVRIRWGDTASEALSDFAGRTDLLPVRRLSVLTAETEQYTPDASQMLYRFSAECRRDVLHAEAKRSGMSIYTAVMYLAFFVYLFVAVILQTVFLDAASLAGTLSAGPYEAVLTAGVLMHGICSGLAAGKMGEGSILSGVKHVCVMFAAGVFTMWICSM